MESNIIHQHNKKSSHNSTNAVSDKNDIQIKSDSEGDNSSVEEEIEVDIPEDTNTCILMSSVFGMERSPTVFFQYNYDVTQLKKHIKENKRFINLEKLNWRNRKHKNFCIMYKAYKNLPDCIGIPMKTNGIVRTKSFLQANLIWKLLKVDKMSVLIKKLNKYQRYNHFPCTWQLGRKDNLWKNYKIMWMQFPDDYNFLPHTFLLPDDYEEMMKEVGPAYETLKKENKEKPDDGLKDAPSMWMIKPVASSRGRGIRLLTNIDSIPKKCLVSKYIHNPHLINNKKYDLRLYIVTSGFSPLKIYLYEEGLVRFASDEYSVEESNKHNRYMHLTNYSVNKCSSHFDKNINVSNECTGSKWSLTALKTYFKSNNMDFEKTWTSIKDIVVKSMISVAEETIETTKKLTKHKNNLFELYGFDILIDADLRPWLLEINLNPSLNCESELDLKVKSSLMTDIFTLVGLMPYSHLPSKYKDPKLYHEVINSQSEGKANLYSQNNNSSTNLVSDCDIITQDSFDGYSSITANSKNDDNSAISQLKYAIDEFSRQGGFLRVFPLAENVDYYSKFLENPGDDNILLWKWLKHGSEVEKQLLDQEDCSVNLKKVFDIKYNI